MLFFTSNRADFGYIFPLIAELDNEVDIEVLVTGAHLLAPWHTVSEVEDKLATLNNPAPIHRIDLSILTDPYLDSSAHIQQHGMNLLKENDYDAVFIVGDRLEIFGFVTAAYICGVPIVHYAGGDIVNVPFFDTNIRHAITKLANVHFTTNPESASVVEQMGEELWRIKSIGNLTYAYDRLGKITPKSELITRFGLDADSKVKLCTMHSYHDLTAAENLSLFQTLLEQLSKYDGQIIVTYPNNDVGSADIIEYLQTTAEAEFPNALFVKSLGTDVLLGVYKHFDTVVVGNSSSGLIETCLYNVPALNIGHRQTDRPRGQNVLTSTLEESDITSKLEKVLREEFKQHLLNQQDNQFFGDQYVALDAKAALLEILERERSELLFKKFLQVQPTS